MIFLVDHNLKGQALILLGNIANKGWLDLLPIRFVKEIASGFSQQSLFPVLH